MPQFSTRSIEADTTNQWRDSGHPIPEVDAARAYVKAQEKPRKWW
jgi:hypothetical protein